MQSWRVRHQAQDLLRISVAEFDAVARLAEQARRTCAELRALLDAPAPVPAGRTAVAEAAPALTLAGVMAGAGITEDDLPTLVDKLIAGYRAAESSADAERRATFARALRTIGRHLASGLGPRAAGLVLH